MWVDTTTLLHLAGVPTHSDALPGSTGAEDMNDSDITNAAIQEIAAILATGYLRYRRAQLAGPSPIDPVDSSATESVHGDEVNGLENQ